MKGNVMNERRDMDTEKQHCQTETHTKERTKMGSETATVFTGALNFIYQLSNLDIRWKQDISNDYFFCPHTKLSNAKSQQGMVLMTSEFSIQETCKNRCYAGFSIKYSALKQ